MQEIFKYLKDLKKAMGKQIVFKIDQVYEGRDEAVGGVLWHLGNITHTFLYHLTS